MSDQAIVRSVAGGRDGDSEYTTDAVLIHESQANDIGELTHVRRGRRDAPPGSARSM